jgi:hypothetical protein
MGVKLVSSGGGSVEVNPPTTASNFTQTLPARTGNIMVDGPAFSAFRSSTNQSLTATVWTKLQLQSEEFDTNSNYDNVTNYRFTPTVAGYYQVTGCMETTGTPTYQYMAIYKNGSLFKRNSVGSSPGTSVTVAALIYCNGSTDYLELYVNSQASVAAVLGSTLTFFQAFLARSA